MPNNRTPQPDAVDNPENGEQQNPSRTKPKKSKHRRRKKPKSKKNPQDTSSISTAESADCCKAAEVKTIETIQESLLSDLECPVCTNLMCQIAICANGHSICLECRERVKFIQLLADFFYSAGRLRTA